MARAPKQGGTPSTQIKLLLQASPGSGKTRAVASFPGLYLYDFNKGFEMYAAAYPTVKYYDDYKRLDQARPPQAFKRFFLDPDSDLKQALADPTCQSIGIEVFGDLQRAIVNNGIWFRFGGKSPPDGALVKPERDDYGYLKAYCLHLLDAIVASGKHVIITAHEDAEDSDIQDYQGGKVKKVLPGGVGASRSAIIEVMDFYWGLDVQKQPGGKKVYTAITDRQFGRDFKVRSLFRDLYPERIDITDKGLYAILEANKQEQVKRLLAEADKLKTASSTAPTKKEDAPASK